MTQVPREPLIRPLGKDTGRWVLAEDFTVVTDAAGTIVVPSGFVTDFNSQPRGTWNVLPPTDFPEAAVPHDFLYQTGRLRGAEITRCLSDQVHRELLVWAGASAWKVFAMYWGLRAGGWRTWSKYRAADAQRAVT